MVIEIICKMLITDVCTDVRIIMYMLVISYGRAYYYTKSRECVLTCVQLYIN